MPSHRLLAEMSAAAYGSLFTSYDAYVHMTDVNNDHWFKRAYSAGSKRQNIAFSVFECYTITGLVERGAPTVEVSQIIVFRGTVPQFLANVFSDIMISIGHQPIPDPIVIARSSKAKPYPYFVTGRFDQVKKRVKKYTLFNIIFGTPSEDMRLTPALIKSKLCDSLFLIDLDTSLISAAAATPGKTYPTLRSMYLLNTTTFLEIARELVYSKEIKPINLLNALPLVVFDAMINLALLSGLPQLQKKDMVFTGHSLGASLALQNAFHHAANIDTKAAEGFAVSAVVFDSPSFSLPENTIIVPRGVLSMEEALPSDVDKTLEYMMRLWLRGTGGYAAPDAIPVKWSPAALSGFLGTILTLKQWMYDLSLDIVREIGTLGYYLISGTKPSQRFLSDAFEEQTRATAKDFNQQFLRTQWMAGDEYSLVANTGLIHHLRANATIYCSAPHLVNTCFKHHGTLIRLDIPHSQCTLAVIMADFMVGIMLALPLKMFSTAISHRKFPSNLQEMELVYSEIQKSDYYQIYCLASITVLLALFDYFLLTKRKSRTATRCCSVAAIQYYLNTGHHQKSTYSPFYLCLMALFICQTLYDVLWSLGQHSLGNMLNCFDAKTGEPLKPEEKIASVGSNNGRHVADWPTSRNNNLYKRVSTTLFAPPRHLLCDDAALEKQYAGDIEYVPTNNQI